MEKSDRGNIFFGMTVNLWENHKRTVLSKADKSFKRSIDAPIVSVVSFINGSECFFTTSSCSGRITLINETGVKRKNSSQFVFVSHDYVRTSEAGEILNRVHTAKGSVFLKLEPLILHIECKSLELALELLRVFKSQSEFKHTSIVSSMGPKTVLCIKAMPKLEIPIVFEGDVIVSEQLLIKYLAIANGRMSENFRAISKLETLVSGGLFHNLANPPRVPEFRAIDTRKVPHILEISRPRESESYLPIRRVLVEAGVIALKYFSMTADAAKVLKDDREYAILPENGFRPIFENSAFIRAHEISENLTLIQVVQSDKNAEMWILVLRNRPKEGMRFKWKKVISRCEAKFLFKLEFEVETKSTESEILLKASNAYFRIDWQA